MSADNRQKKLIDQLVSVMQSLLAQQIKLMALLSQKRTALRSADYHRVTELCQLENKIVQSFAQREKQRLQLTADITLTIEPEANEPMRLSVLAQHLAEPDRGRLLVLRRQLKEQMLKVQKETSIARRATQSLVTHMQGLVQPIG